MIAIIIIYTYFQYQLYFYNCFIVIGNYMNKVIITNNITVLTIKKDLTIIILLCKYSHKYHSFLSVGYK